MSKPLVFITGATGFIGSQVVASTLKAGYRVRLSIRKPEQEATIRNRYPEHSNDIEISVIPDLSDRQVFGQALKDVNYIFHLASPMPGQGVDVRRDYVDPAINMTTALLYAALDAKEVKKVIITSSLLSLAPVDAILSRNGNVKENTNEIIPVDLSASFPEGFTGEALRYAASKILAHQATRDFLKENSPHYSVATFHPTFVLGDSLIQEKPEDIDGMNGLFWISLMSDQPKIANSWVHVRDVADAHVKALETESASGTEFILARPVSWNNVALFVQKTYPALESKLQPPIEGEWVVETTAADNILKMNWRSEETIVRDVVDQQLSLRAKTSSI
ncbi:NAD(P)-binding protein [Penicillium macrosclerotiorum]|uniref:NAD(P)-binding protein n=1 Tax=Penicillium macrosclerotiorum TaxID=303699 RepID=UPI002547B8D0|nr:NAD(P)-binding protein [Penicillium macrosclerotiorum]KAJ5698938.1 NAD(P)-binding protein [Penicillium macrosclerotiorum]